jgi:hypothetical protein
MLLPFVLLAQSAAVLPASTASFTPPLGVVIRQTGEEVRDDGRSRRTFRIERDIVFATDAEGYRATVTLRTATADAPPEERERYRLANAPMIGRPVVIRLDRAGRLRGIEDLAAVWAAWSSGLAATSAPGADRDADALRARLNALPPDRTAAMVGSMVTQLVVPAAERTPVAARPVSLASPPPFGSVMLNGTGSAAMEGERLRIRVVATGEAPTTPGRAGARIAVTANRLADLATGLQVASHRSEKVSGPGVSLSVSNTIALSW